MVETVSEPHQQAIRHFNAAIPPAKNRPELLVDIFNIIGAAVAAVEREAELVEGDLCEGVNRACMSESVCGCVWVCVCVSFGRQRKSNTPNASEVLRLDSLRSSRTSLLLSL